MTKFLLALVAIAVALTWLQVLLAWRMRRRLPFAGGLHEQAGWRGFLRDDSTTIRLSILKPMCGLDDGLRDNLRSFVDLPGMSYEVILSVAEPGDPSLGVAQSIMEQFPDAPFRIVIGGSTRTFNPKVERLIAAASVARGEILLVSDSNVRVSEGDVQSTLGHFTDSQVGCVSNLFTGEAAQSFGARLESLHLLTFVVPGCALAASFNTPCVVGKSMALRRETLHRIGGFEAFGEVLAEDQAIGLAVRDAGYRVVVSPVVVRNVVIQRSLRKAAARQIRWNKIRFSFSRPIYASEFLLQPLPWSILTFDPSIVLAVLLIRILQADLLSRATGTSASLLLVPVQDLLQFAGQFVPFFSRTVEWRGHYARLGRGTRMEPLVLAES